MNMKPSFKIGRLSFIVFFFENSIILLIQTNNIFDKNT